MPLVIKNKDSAEEVKQTPHLAITHNELQNGAANKRNVSLLLKSDVELTEDAKKLLKSLLGEDVQLIEKASYNSLRKQLDDAIKKFSTDRWDWSYVEDFDETNVVFSNSDGVYYVDYRVDDDQVVLGNTAYPVNRIISYEESSGKLILTEAAGVDTNVRSLIVKSFDNISKNEKVVDVYKSKLLKGKLMEVDIQKAQGQISELTVQLQKAVDLQKAAEVERDALKEQMEAITKAQEDAKSAKRLEEVKAVVKAEDEAVALHKSLEVLSDEAFATVLKSMKLKDEVVENSELFIQKSSSTEALGEQGSTLDQLLKAEFAPKA